MKHAAIALLLSACASAAPPPEAAPDPCVGLDAGTYDLGCDFSFASDPNGPWQYGYASSLAPEHFIYDGYVDLSDPVGSCHPSAAAYYPYVAWNSTAEARVDATDSWAVRPHEVAMEAVAGQYAIARFVVPKSGAYSISTTFEGVHFRHSTTDVHVRLDANELFAAEIDGYGGLPAFHAIEGTNPTASFEASLDLTAGQILAFAVGVGTNGTNANDTTAVQARITSR
jgi:hypothetical protein